MGEFTSKTLGLMLAVMFLAAIPLHAQGKRLWVLRSSGEMVEYDPETFAAKQSIKVPAEAVNSPQQVSVNHAGQILFTPALSLPLDEGDLIAMGKIWFWDGHLATSLDRDARRSTGKTGSNLSIDESVPTPYLAEDGTLLYWFSNQAHRLQRDGVDLSTKNTWQAWQTDLASHNRKDIASAEAPDCSCPTGGCEDTCTYARLWARDEGVSDYFLVTQLVTGKDQPSFKSTSLYRESAGKWNGTAIDPPLRRILDAANPNTILEAVPDTGCCGWSNQSDDQTLLRLAGKTLAVFDERAEYDNPDYDVSFYTTNGQLSPRLDAVAFTVVATGEANKPIQLSEQGQGNPEESEHIQKALLELPAVELKSIDATGTEPPHRLELIPHAELAGWITDKEILLVEEHALVLYNVSRKARRKTNVNVEDAAHVFLR